MEGFFITILDLIGTFVFAVSGIRLASGKNIDWFGAYVIGLVTAIGGGTVRDLLLGVTPFWMLQSKYFLTIGVALLAALVFKNKLLRLGSTLFLFDTIGLGLFTIVGISKSLAAGYPFWVCIVMGTVTGSVGGIIRDVLLNELPLIFRGELYAMACIAGGIVYYLCRKVGFSGSLTELTASIVVITVRLLAVKFNLHLPVLKAFNPPSGHDPDKP